MKYLLSVLLILLSLQSWALSPAIQAVVGINGAPADYCTTQTWATLTSFKLDFGHTTDTKTACLSTGTELGITSAGTTISTPTPASPGSGGGAITGDATAEYIDFDNSLPYFQSQYGELYLKALVTGNNANDTRLLGIVQTANEDQLIVQVTASGGWQALWEDHNSGVVSVIVSGAYDLDAAGYNHWAQIHVKWDTTRCTDTGENCADAGEDELCMRVRIDTNDDGDFGDGGAEDWSSYSCETDATDMLAWTAEPTTDDFKFGLVTGTYDVQIWVDDVEINYAQPAW